MLTLAIETSGPIGTVALLDEDRGLEERTLELGRHHGQALVPEIGRLLADHGRRARDCGLIAVSAGPGSFTGLRVGVVCAKTLAYAAGCPVAAVDTLLAVACNSPAGIAVVQAVCDAQRGDLFVGRYTRDAAGTWARAAEITIENAEAWLAGLGREDAVSGPGLAGLEGRVEKATCIVLPNDCWQPRASAVGQIACRAAERGEVSDPWSLEPFYFRRSSAEEKWELRQRNRTV
jgi:tRNA threonylcarbamoyladenosine biosynthesis protein TsaB